MDFLSQSITQNNQIAPYLENLKSERQNYERVQDLLSNEFDEYIKLGVVLNRTLVNDKLFRVTVKAFDDVFDLCKFGVVDVNAYKKYNCKFYFVQIHVSNLFQSKIINDDWYANVFVMDDANTVSKTIRLKNVIPSEPINVIVPFTNVTIPCKIHTTFFTTTDSFFPNIQINSTHINVSYFFSPYTDTKSPKPNPIYTTSRLYTDRIKLNPSKPLYEYTFTCKCDRKRFLETLLKNCYHRLNLNQLQNLTASTDVIDVNLSVGDAKSDVKFDSKGTLKITAELQELYDIKRYILEELTSKKYSIENKILTAVQNLRKQLAIEKQRSNIDIGNIEIIYREYKELIAKLPV